MNKTNSCYLIKKETPKRKFKEHLRKTILSPNKGLVSKWMRLFGHGRSNISLSMTIIEEGKLT